MKPHEVFLDSNLKAILDGDKTIIQVLDSKGKVIKEVEISFKALNKLNIHAKYVRRKTRREKQEMIF